LNPGAFINEFEVFENLNALFIIRKKLKILVRHQLSKLGDVLLYDPFVMTHSELGILA